MDFGHQAALEKLDYRFPTKFTVANDRTARSTFVVTLVASGVLMISMIAVLASAVPTLGSTSARGQQVDRDWKGATHAL